MATGLHPDHHGVVNNGFYDRTQDAGSVFDSLDVRTPILGGADLEYGGTALTANIFMWPGKVVPTAAVRRPSGPATVQTGPLRADWVIDARIAPSKRRSRSW